MPVNSIRHFKEEANSDSYLVNGLLLLKEKLGDVTIYGIRTTTLFERVAKDGKEWFKNIHHDKGEHQLNKSRIAHEQIYNAIANLGVVS